MTCVPRRIPRVSRAGGLLVRDASPVFRRNGLRILVSDKQTVPGGSCFAISLIRSFDKRTLSKEGGHSSIT